MESRTRHSRKSKAQPWTKDQSKPRLRNGNIKYVDTETTNSEIDKMSLGDLVYGGYHILKKRKIGLGNYNLNKDKMTRDGDKFIMVNVGTNSSMNVRHKVNGDINTNHWGGHGYTIRNQCVDVPNAMPLYCHKEKNDFCFTTRSTNDAFSPNAKSDKDKKFYLYGRKGYSLYFYNHPGGSLKDYRGFKIYDENNRAVTDIYYCRRYKIRQVNNTDRINGRPPYVTVNGEDGYSVFNPDHEKHQTRNDTFIFFPYIDIPKNTCLSFDPEIMKNEAGIGLWFGRQPQSLINYCKEVVSNMCSAKNNAKGVKKYPILSSGCFDFYRSIFNEGPNSQTRRKFDKSIKSQCRELYNEDNIRQKCACQYPIFAIEDEEKRDPNFEIPTKEKNASICFSVACRGKQESAYQSYVQEHTTCPGTFCYAGHIKADRLNIIQECGENDEGDDDEDGEWKRIDQPTDPNADPGTKEPPPRWPSDEKKDPDLDKNPLARPNDKDNDTDPTTKRLNTFLWITGSLMGISIIALVLYVILRNRNKKE